ncbi:hypothetical protein CFK39_12685 [Brachybacterium avium]|uniref:DUF4235 domain-containing protein n=1 Tax=Brachybacterium avium TaxID=2017485 RepID=A0A220UFN7_9MICO|nr:DUF4235 domain-containing protein [Brachybacterium avium]ASK66523.1 hypothetical protein CFK39_12685 [Brachybacterium avium]
MANPLVSIAVPVAGIVAAKLGTKAAAAGWGAVFGEEAPTVQAEKAAKKNVAKRRKQAKKDGLPKSEIAAIKDPVDEQPVWKMMLWATVSGVLLQGLRMAAKRGAKSGAERLTMRRPRPNRG